MKEAEFLLTEQDKENNAIIKKLVKERFSLSDDSLNYFNQQIDNPFIDENYFSAFEKFGSSKIELDLPFHIQERLDYGWQNIVKIHFNDFLRETGATYEHFKNNKIEINKNFFKFKKAIESFYINKTFKIIEDNFSCYDKIENYEEVAYIIRNLVRNKIPPLFSRSLQTAVFGYVLSTGKDDKDEILYFKNEIKYSIQSAVENVWRDVSNNKLSSDNLKIVITFSFADWFLCSTNESWGSCLALTGNSANYWYGLPGLIGDKNRVMIYITRGDKKDYRGIKTHRYLYRTWALLDDRNRINIVRWFPREDLHNQELYNFLSNKTGLRFNENSIDKNDDYHSKYELDLIWNVDGYSMFPYQDYTDWTEGENTYIISGNSGMLYKSKSDRYREVMSDELYSYDTFSSLGDLIERNTTICDATDETHTCEDCGRRVDYEDDLYISPNGDRLCHSCFHDNYFECNDCGEVYHIDYAMHIKDGLVCDNCFHDSYFIDESDDRVYDLEFAVSATDDRNGNCEYLIHIENAEAKGYIYNEEDGIYYKPEYMVEINGNWVHKDIAEKGQLELELAV